MNNIKNPLNTSSLYIYNQDLSSYDNTDDFGANSQHQVVSPFTLSISSNYQSNYSFTQSSKNDWDEVCEVSPIDNLWDLLNSLHQDTTSGVFVGENRRKTNWKSTDVLFFDVDNDEQEHQEYFDDFDNHLTIEKITELFKNYEFIITTSKNHQKDKETTWGGTRTSRHKYHILFPLGKTITDLDESEKYYDMLNYFVNDGKSQVSLVDTGVASVSHIKGNRDTIIYYNKGESIYELLHQTDFTYGYERHRGNNRKRKYSITTEGSFDNGSNEVSTDDFYIDWDYVNITERLRLDYFYNLSGRHQGDGTGYFSAFCDLHQDNKPSLLVFNNGGFYCKGCKKSGGSAIKYLSLKTGTSTAELRKDLCREHGINYNNYLLWLDGEKIKQQREGLDTQSLKDDEDEAYEGSDTFDFSVTDTEELWVDKKTYKQLQEMNLHNAVLSQDGNVSVMLWETNRNSEIKEIKYQSIADFRNRYKNRRYKVKYIFPKERIHIMSIADIWEIWEERRQYDGIDFHPYDEMKEYDEHENIWDIWNDWDTANDSNDWCGDKEKRGLNKFMDLDTLNLLSGDEQFERGRDGIEKYLHHIDTVICGNYSGQKHHDLNNYILCWLSKLMTTHGKDRVKVAPVLMGRQGCGKGTMVNPIGEIFGKRHYLPILDSDRLTGNFNIHLMDKLLVYVNEAIFAGNRSVMNKLKGLLTEDEIQLEAKYMNSFVGRSFLRFIYSSNEDWVIPLEWDDRRYLVIDVTDEWVNNPQAQKYFDGFWDEWNNGFGKEHLYSFLTSKEMIGRSNELNYEYDRPRTVATASQTLMTDPLVAWIHQVLSDGGHTFRDINGSTQKRWWEENKKNRFVVDELFEDFISLNRKTGRSWNGRSQTMSDNLNKLASQNQIEFRKVRINPKTASRQGLTDKTGKGVTTCWEWGTLKDLRKLWVDNLWGGDENAAWGETDILDLEIETENVSGISTEFLQMKQDSQNVSTEKTTNDGDEETDTDDTLKYFDKLAEDND